MTKSVRILLYTENNEYPDQKYYRVLLDGDKVLKATIEDKPLSRYEMKLINDWKRQHMPKGCMFLEVTDDMFFTTYPNCISTKDIVSVIEALEE